MAIKVIDKMRFPTKQESQLRNEVAILQVKSCFVLVLIFVVCCGFLFWRHCAACEILFPRPGIEPSLPTLGVWSFNHWTPREVLR